MSDSPRTDAAECEFVPSADPNYDGPYRWVEASLARELERELATCRGERDEAVSFIRVIGEEVMRNGYPCGDRATTLANMRREFKRANENERSLQECRGELKSFSKLYDKEVLAHGETEDRAEAAERSLEQVRAAALTKRERAAILSAIGFALAGEWPFDGAKFSADDLESAKGKIA